MEAVAANLTILKSPTTLRQTDGRFWGLFTPWHIDDLNSALKQNGAYPLFRRAVGPNLEPVWPEKWPVERLASRRGHRVLQRRRLAGGRRGGCPGVAGRVPGPVRPAPGMTQC